ncbi:MAG: CoA transferase [Acidobacteriota bacterium]
MSDSKQSPASTTSAAGPLSGYRILDLTTMVSGPMATLLLGDQGADVIKVETTTGGDLTRHLGPQRGGLTAIFVTLNRNKRSLAIDLKSERGREVLLDMIRDTDVFVQNFRPGAAERMGLDEATLRAIRPDLIYVSISGFGEKGPYANKRVYDPIIQGLSGLASIQADAEGRPKMVRLIVPDKLTAMTAAQAITAALLARERTGKGQHVRLSMLDAMVSFLWPEGMTAHTLVGDGVGNRKRGSLADLIYETKDGYITVSTMSDLEWEALARATEHEEWITDPRFETAALRMRNFADRRQMVGETLTERTSAEWLERFEAEDVPCAPINTREDLLVDPQIAENELIVEMEHPLAGSVRMTRPAARFDETPTSLRLPAPGLGEQSLEVLEEAGLGAEELAQLQEDGVVVQFAAE